jgi:hypothetical protein
MRGFLTSIEKGKMRESEINESGEVCACDKRSGVPISASPSSNHSSRYEECTCQLLRRSTKFRRRFDDRERVSVRSEIIHPRHKIKRKSKDHGVCSAHFHNRNELQMLPPTFRQDRRKLKRDVTKEGSISWRVR